MKSSRINYYRQKHRLLVFYIMWQIVTYLVVVTTFLYNNIKYRQISLLVSSFCVTSFYQGLGISLLQLQWSAALIDIHSTFTLVNDKLEILLTILYTTIIGHQLLIYVWFSTDMRRRCYIKDLKTRTTRNKDISVQGSMNTMIATELELQSISSLHLSYDTICDILKQMGDENGPFLLINFLLLFLHLLITPYNVIIVYNNNESGFIIAQQVNWCLLHFGQLLTLVEPCHWLLEQRECTKRLLSGLTCQAASYGQGTAELKPFLLQMQLLDFTMAPCYVFSISRPLLASIIGGVITYLIIIVQYQTIPETI